MRRHGEKTEPSTRRPGPRSAVAFLALALAAAPGPARADLLILVSGGALEVESWEVEGGLVTFRTSEGTRGSLQLAQVDLEATRAANGAAPAPESTEPSLPPASPTPAVAPSLPPPARASEPPPPPSRGAATDAPRAADLPALARELLEATNIREIVELGLPGAVAPLLSGVEEMRRGDAARDELAWAAALDSGAAWTATVESLAAADPALLERWTRWVRSPRIARLLELEKVEVEPSVRDAWLEAHAGTLPAARRAVCERLTRQLAVPEIMVEPFATLVDSTVGRFQARQPALFRYEEARARAVASIRSRMQAILEDQGRRAPYRYRDATDEDLAEYARYWETPDGSALRDALARAMDAGCSRFGEQAGEALAASLVLPPPARSVALPGDAVRFAPPGASWVELALGGSELSGVRAAYWHRDWDVLVLVFAEELAEPVASGSPDAGLYPVGAEGGWTPVEDQASDLGGAGGRLFLEQLPSRRLWRLRWAASRGGVVYQVHAISTAGLGAGPARELARAAFGGLDLPGGTDAPPADVASAPAPRVREELNFRFTPPPRPWVEWNLAELNPDATLGYLRTRPGSWMMLIAEKGLGNVTAEAMAEIVRANLASAVEEYELRSSEPVTVGGLPGILLETDVKLSGHELHYVQWVLVHRGFAYQLSMHAARGTVEPAELRATALDVFSGFELLDPERGAVAEQATPAVLESTRYGYRLDLGGTGWKAWTDVANEFESAESGALLGLTAAFAVVPVALPDLDPSPEALAAGLLATMDVGLGDGALRRGTADPSGAWQAFDYEVQLEKRAFEYRLRVVRSGAFAWLLAAWKVAASDVTVETLDGILDAVEPVASAAPPADLSALPPAERATHEKVLGAMGRYHYDREEWPESAIYLRAAYELEQDDAELLSLYANALVSSEQYQAALDYLEPRLERHPDDLEMQSYRPFLLYKLERFDEAMPLYAELFRRGHRNDYDARDYSHLLVDRGRSEEAFALLRALREAQDTNFLVRLEAALHRRVDDLETATRVLEERVAVTAYDEELIDRLLEAYLDGERYAEVRDRVASLREAGHTSANLNLHAARAEYRLGNRQEAKRLLESAAEMEPGNREVADELANLSGILGEGDNAALRQEIAPVELPDELGAGRGPAPADLPDSGAYYLYRTAAISFVSGVEHRRTESMAVRVLDSEAVDAFGALRLQFDPLYERLYVNRLDVLDAEGRVRSSGRISDYYVTDANEYDGDDDQLAHLPVAGLEPGFTLELVYTRENLSPPVRMPFTRRLLSTSEPGSTYGVFLTGDVERVRTHSRHLPPPRRGDGWLYWSVEAYPGIESAPLVAPYESFLPYLWLGDAEGSWEDLARGYLDDIESRLKPTDEVRRLAGELTAGLASPEDRIQALADYVQRTLTYRSIEFGQRAMMPTPVDEILSNRYGDCKDHAVLLHQLLTAAGVPSRLALASFASEVQPEVPSLGQFNHMIVHLPGREGGQRFIDATDKGYDVASLSPLALGGRLALILDPERPALAEIPHYGAESHRLESERSVRARESDLEVEETLRAEGYMAASLRRMLRGRTSAEQLSEVRSRLGLGSDVELQELQVEELDVSSRPLTLKLRYRVEDALPGAGGRLVGRLPALWERAYLALERVDHRLPFAQEYPLLVRSRITVEAPDGFRLVEPGSVEEGARGRFAEWSLGSAREGNRATLSFELRRPASSGGPGEYAELERSLRTALGALERVVVLDRAAAGS